MNPPLSPIEEYYKANKKLLNRWALYTGIILLFYIVNYIVADMALDAVFYRMSFFTIAVYAYFFFFYYSPFLRKWRILFSEVLTPLLNAGFSLEYKKNKKFYDPIFLAKQNDSSISAYVERRDLCFDVCINDLQLSLDSIEDIPLIESKGRFYPNQNGFLLVYSTKPKLEIDINEMLKEIEVFRLLISELD